MLRIMFILNI